MPVHDPDTSEPERRIVNEEYKIWKKNTPYLYDVVIQHASVWPSLTCQWFPDIERRDQVTVQRLLMGTHTSGTEQDALIISEIQIPVQPDALDHSKFDDDKGEIGGYDGTAAARVHVMQKIPHAGEVNRARYMPQNPDIIATKATSGDVFLFDRTKHPSFPDARATCKPNLTLKGHTKEGFGLDWSTSVSGHLLSCAEDHLICHWDVQNGFTKGASTLNPLRTYKGHDAIVSDVNWHHLNYIFATGADDSLCMLWDTRKPEGPTAQISGHTGCVNAVSFSPANDYILATASADSTVGLWDIRNVKRELHKLQGHTGEVVQVNWSPSDETVLSTAGVDRKVNLWDLSRIGDEQTPEDAEDGPPELLFSHRGHLDRMADVSWSPNVSWMLASVSEDNMLTVWSPAANLYLGDQAKIAESELE